MDDRELLELLEEHFAQHDRLHGTEAGQLWLSQAAALVEHIDVEGAARIRQRAQTLALPLSIDMLEPMWNQVLQTVRDAIAKARVQSTKAPSSGASVVQPRRVFIGHGQSSEWRVLKDFLVDRLRLEYDEFNRDPAAGLSTTERLSQMLDSSGFALLVMTAEEEQVDGSFRARANVIHEIGLFQGRYGFRRAIILLEQGCAEFSNIQGLTQIRFPPRNILAASEEVRRVLEREGLLSK